MNLNLTNQIRENTVEFPDFVARIAKTRHTEHLVKLWQTATEKGVEQGQLMYSLALQGKARLIWARAGLKVHCPKCGSTNVTLPDEEGLIDCLKFTKKCGKFDIVHPENVGSTPMAYFPILQNAKIEVGPGAKFKIVPE